MNTWEVQNATEKMEQWWNQGRDQKIPEDKWQWNTTVKTLWDTASCSKKEVYIKRNFLNK